MSHTLEYNGEELSLREWAERTKIPYSVIYSRIRLGWTAERILTTPTRRPQTIGSQTVREISQRTGLGRTTLYSRLRSGASEEELVKRHPNSKRNVVNTDQFRKWLFNFIVEYKREHDGIAPTLYDIRMAAQRHKAYAGVSIGSIKWGLLELRNQGQIELAYNQPRFIKVIGGTWQYTGGSDG